MPQIDFYLLKGNHPQQRLLTCCRLASKIYGLGLPLTIYCDDESWLRQLDERLWTFDPASFIPHEITTASTPAQAPVRLSRRLDSDIAANSVLLTLANEIPPEHRHFSRVAEVIDENDEGCRLAGRQRYREYQQQGYPIKVHRL